MAKTLALIHTAPVLIPVFQKLCEEYLDGIDVFNIVDESLLKNTIRDGELSAVTVQRLVGYVQSAKQAGADVVLVTCSSIGRAVEAARAVVDLPVLRIDEAMADEAVQSGRRIGVAATLRSTLDPTLDLIKTRAVRANRRCEVVARLCEGAFQAVASGDTKTHDRIVQENLLVLMGEVDVVVLAQASMARVVDAMDPANLRVPVLSSPRRAIEQANEVLRLIP
ncbi:MAG: aspartate/glutamate racemase family protein [Acidobacteria bacterium]|nr:aspartate/glutamate racemase family protein [Acidobacteriota bacterium]